MYFSAWRDSVSVENLFIALCCFFGIVFCEAGYVLSQHLLMTDNCWVSSQQWILSWVLWWCHCMTLISWWHWVRAGHQWDWGWHLWENSKRLWEGLSNAGFRVLEWLARETRSWGCSCNQFQGNQIYYVAIFFLPTKKKKKFIRCCG